MYYLSAVYDYPLPIYSAPASVNLLIQYVIHFNPHRTRSPVNPDGAARVHQPKVSDKSNFISLRLGEAETLLEASLMPQGVDGAGGGGGREMWTFEDLAAESQGVVAGVIAADDISVQIQALVYLRDYSS